MFKFFITNPLGWILGQIYQFVGNYGWAIILFTVIIKLILLPLGIKQQKSMIKIQRIQPKLLQLQEKYKNDNNKLSEETMKLYKERGINPMGGCLPTLIQLPILYGLYKVIYSPLTYILRYSQEHIEELISAAGLAKNYQAEIIVANLEKLMDFTFLGINLSSVPKISEPSVLWVIPILAGLTTFLSGKLTSALSGKKDEKKDADQKPKRVLSAESDPKKSEPNSMAMGKTMTYMMPLMTLWIAFSVPSALGLYWVVSNVLMVIQQLLLNALYSKKYNEELDLIEAPIEEEKAKKKKKKKK